MGSGGTLVDVSTSSAIIFAYSFVTTSGVKVVSISIANIVIVIETSINIGTDGTIFIVIGVTGNAGTAESSSAHCVFGNTIVASLVQTDRLS